MIFAGGVFCAAAAQTASLAEMQHQLEMLDSQEAALTAWMAQVEEIRAATVTQRGIYDDNYVGAMQRSIAAVHEKRLMLARAIAAERQRPAGAAPPK